MTQNLATPPPREPDVFLVDEPRRGIRGWVLALSVVVAFVAGFAVASTLPRDVLALPGSTPTPTATPTPTETPDTEDDSQFVEDAVRDINDFDDDLDDLQTTLDENGFWRLLSNAVELNFNLTQLNQTTAPKSIRAEWNDGLDDLQSAIDQIESGITGNSSATIQGGIDDAKATIADLRDLVSTVD